MQFMVSIQPDQIKLNCANVNYSLSFMIHGADHIATKVVVTMVTNNFVHILQCKMLSQRHIQHVHV